MSRWPNCLCLRDPYRLVPVILMMKHRAQVAHVHGLSAGGADVEVVRLVRRIAAATVAVAAIHRKVRQVRADCLHKLSHRLTAKADALVVETLDVRAMSRSLRLGKSVADAALGTLLRQVAYKADWRGRTLIAADKWFASTKLCCVCHKRHAMPLKQRVMRCECSNTIDRDENASVNLYWYPEEPGNRAGNGATRGEIGCQVAGVSPPPVPIGEPRMLAELVHDHESQ